MNVEAQILIVKFAWRYQCLLLSCSKSNTVTYFLKIVYVKRITSKICQLPFSKNKQTNKATKIIIKHMVQTMSVFILYQSTLFTM